MDTKTFTGYVIFKCFAHEHPFPTRVHVGKNWELVNRAPVPCNGCGKMLPWKWGKMLYGILSETFKCDPRCWNAHGPDCTCQCGGMGHGQSYDIFSKPIATVALPQVFTIKAKYSGYCSACKHYYLEGAEIKKLEDGKWGHLKCVP